MARGIVDHRTDQDKSKKLNVAHKNVLIELYTFYARIKSSAYVCRTQQKFNVN